MTDGIDQEPVEHGLDAQAGTAGSGESPSSAVTDARPADAASAASAVEAVAAPRADVSARWGSVLAGLTAQGPTPRAPPRFNPHPRGEICPGSATAAVRDFLRRRHDINPHGWVSRYLIVDGTGRSGKAVDWALIFLRTNKLIEASEDPRNARYLRYRLALHSPATKS